MYMYTYIKEIKDLPEELYHGIIPWDYTRIFPMERVLKL